MMQSSGLRRSASFANPRLNASNSSYVRLDKRMSLLGIVGSTSCGKFMMSVEIGLNGAAATSFR